MDRICSEELDDIIRLEMMQESENQTKEAKTLRHALADWIEELQAIFEKTSDSYDIKNFLKDALDDVQNLGDDLRVCTLHHQMLIDNLDSFLEECEELSELEELNDLIAEIKRYKRFSHIDNLVK